MDRDVDDGENSDADIEALEAMDEEVMNKGSDVDDEMLDDQEDSDASDGGEDHNEEGDVIHCFLLL